MALLFSATAVRDANGASMTAFPGEVGVCIDNGACTMPTLFVNSRFMQAYKYTDHGVEKYLMAYDLYPPSNQGGNFSRVDLDGSVWLGMQQVYDLAEERHAVNLYLDQVTPSPANLWVLDSDGLDVVLTLTTPDLLAGGGFFNLGENIDGTGFFLNGDLGTLGDLGQGGYPLADNHSMLPCLAMSCEVGASLNLVFMMVVEQDGEGLVGFDLTDNRSLLYEQYQDWAFDDTWFFAQSYHVVPVPAAVWMLLSALAALGVVGTQGSAQGRSQDRVP